MSSTSQIGLSRNQRVFVALEATAGTLEWPSATQDYIRPAGNATLNQNPAFVDSEELSSTLDLLDQFQNALPAGSWEVPFYVRPSGTVGGRPQGYDLLKSLQGDVNAATTAALNAQITPAATVAVIKTIAGGTMPHAGVITIGTEKIKYEGYEAAGATLATLLSLTRSWGGSTAATHAGDAVVTLNSLWFKQKITQPSCTVWVETDHFVQALTGATANRAVIGVSNTGAVKMTCSGQGMRMYWAGTSALTVGGASAATQLTVPDGKLYCAGMRIWNKTKAINNTNAGWKINSVVGNVLHLDAALGVNWATGDLVAGFLPTGTAIGDPIEGRDTTVKVNGVTAKLKSMDLTLDLPKKYIEDEIGVEAPEDYIEDRRTISSALSLYFRRSDAKYFKDGYDGSEAPVLITFGVDDGYIMDVYMPRCILEVPAINFAPPAIELNIPFKALGTTGEDSCEILFN